MFIKKQINVDLKYQNDIRSMKNKNTNILSRIIYFLIIPGMFLFIQACQYEFIEPEEVIIPEVVSYTDDIIPIFNNKCNFSGCHVSGFAILDLSPTNAYADLFRKDLINLDNPELSDLYLKLNTANSTHKGRSTDTEQATILEWIKKGAKNN